MLLVAAQTITDTLPNVEIKMKKIKNNNFFNFIRRKKQARNNRSLINPKPHPKVPIQNVEDYLYYVCVICYSFLIYLFYIF